MPLPHRRRVGDGSTWLSRVLWGLAIMASTFVFLSRDAGPAPFAYLACAPAAALGMLLFDDDRALTRPARAFLLALGTAITTATLVLWLAEPRPNPWMMLCAPWLVGALLLRRSVGADAPRLMLWLPTLLLAAAALLWINLLSTIQWHPNRAQIDVVAGWPWSCHIGAIHNHHTPGVATLPSALWLDYAVMLGFAAIPLWRRPMPFLIRWLPRLAVLLAILSVVGAGRLILAADG